MEGDHQTEADINISFYMAHPLYMDNQFFKAESCAKYKIHAPVHIELTEMIYSEN
jgi:hypothetical protein